MPVLMGKLNTNFDLGDIALAPDTKQLEEVLVTGDRNVVASTFAFDRELVTIAKKGYQKVR